MRDDGTAWGCAIANAEAVFYVVLFWGVVLFLLKIL
jgi:hypothetical protein